MEQRLKYSEKEAKAVLSKHQHKATRQRVGVLLLLMNQKRAFSLKNLTDALSETTDRVTIYRTLKLFLEEGIAGKAMNDKGHTCFFYLDHLLENKHTQAYLECENCDQIFGLPALPDQYLNKLNRYQATPLATLLKGQCQRSECCGEQT